MTKLINQIGPYFFPLFFFATLFGHTTILLKETWKALFFVLFFIYFTVVVAVSFFLSLNVTIPQYKNWTWTSTRCLNFSRHSRASVVNILYCLRNVQQRQQKSRWDIHKYTLMKIADKRARVTNKNDSQPVFNASKDKSGSSLFNNTQTHTCMGTEEEKKLNTSFQRKWSSN